MLESVSSQEMDGDIVGYKNKKKKHIQSDISIYISIYNAVIQCKTSKKNQVGVWI